MASSTLSNMKLCERLRAARFLLRNRYLGRQLKLQRERSASNGCLVTTWRQREGGSEGCRRERGDRKRETHRERNREREGGREIERVRERQGGGEREEKEKGDKHCNLRCIHMYIYVHQ